MRRFLSNTHAAVVTWQLPPILASGEPLVIGLVLVLVTAPYFVAAFYGER